MMLSHSFSIFILSTFVSAQAQNYSKPGAATPCKDIHIFLARGNNEPYPGRQGKLVSAICNGLPSCDYEDIQFYNPYEASYAASVQEGATNGVTQVTAYAEACPTSKIVLSGYSQGANVVGDVLGGGYGVFFHNFTQSPVKGIDQGTGKQIKAVLLFGDTRHTAGQTYNVQTGARATGLFPRPADLLATLNQYAAVMRSYCVATDPICAASLGSEDATTHLNYFEVFSTEAAGWVREMVNSTGASVSTSMTTSPATSSHTLTSTSSQTSSVPTNAPSSTLTDTPEIPVSSTTTNIAKSLKAADLLYSAVFLSAIAIWNLL